jgi:hypothetical protein
MPKLSQGTNFLLNTLKYGLKHEFTYFCYNITLTRNGFKTFDFSY